MDPARLSQGYPGPRSEQGQTSKPQQRLDTGGGGGGGGGRINPSSPSPPPRKSSLASSTAGSREQGGFGGSTWLDPAGTPPLPDSILTLCCTRCSQQAAAAGQLTSFSLSERWEWGGCVGDPLVTCSPSSLHISGLKGDASFQMGTDPHFFQGFREPLQGKQPALAVLSPH